MKTVLSALWSVIAWPLAFLWQGAIVVGARPIAWFIPFREFQAKWPARMMGMLPRISGSGIDISYHPDFDPDVRSLFVQNHVSMFDGHIALRTIPGYFCGIENASHYRIPFYGWLMKEGGSIPIYPGRPGQSERIAEDARDRIGKGYSILGYPEGHRTRDGSIGSFRRGLFLMAIRVGIPVVPLAVRGLHEVFPKGTWILRRGHIQIWVGPQISTQGLVEEDADELSAHVHRLMTHWLETGEAPAKEELQFQPSGRLESRPA